MLTDSAAAAASVTTKSAVAASPVIVPPSSLVERVCKLYNERIHDVRCLIPVLVGLSKQEVIRALPGLVQLKDKVVKDVLTRLLYGKWGLGNCGGNFCGAKLFFRYCRRCFLRLLQKQPACPLSTRQCWRVGTMSVVPPWIPMGRLLWVR